MFGDAISMSWSDFFASGGAQPKADQSTAANAGVLNPGPGDIPNAIPPNESLTTAQINQTAADARNVQELQARIKAGGGVVTASPNSTDYVVAVNNKTRFSVTRAASGQFEIRESQNFYYLIGAAVLIGVLLLAKK